jgi:hypothetical protein
VSFGTGSNRGVRVARRTGNQSRFKMPICLDEFQQILNFDGQASATGASAEEGDCTARIKRRKKGHIKVNRLFVSILVGCHLRREVIEFAKNHEPVRRGVGSNPTESYSFFRLPTILISRWRASAHQMTRSPL